MRNQCLFALMAVVKEICMERISEQNLIRAWMAVSEDLGIVIVAPFVLTGVGGEECTCIAWLPDFGSPSGTIIFHYGVPERARLLAKQQGYFWSALEPTAYGHYDRQHFIDTLNDWGWFGEYAHAPPWYTGIPWS